MDCFSLWTPVSHFGTRKVPKIFICRKGLGFRTFRVNWTNSISWESYHPFPEKYVLKRPFALYVRYINFTWLSKQFSASFSLVWSFLFFMPFFSFFLIFTRWPVQHRRSGSLQHIPIFQLRSQIPRETFVTMIGDVIDCLRITAPAVNREFVRKSQIEISTCHRVSYSKIWYVNLHATPFSCPMFTKFAQWKRRK